MNMTMDHSEDGQDNRQDPNSCCENITEHLQVDEDVHLKKSQTQLDINFAIALFQTFVFGMDFSESESPEVPRYTSPPPFRDLHILYETYLI